MRPRPAGLLVCTLYTLLLLLLLAGATSAASEECVVRPAAKRLAIAVCLGMSPVTGACGAAMGCPDHCGVSCDLPFWDVSGMTSFRQWFKGASDFDGDLSRWNMSAAQDVRGMFQDATNFTGTRGGGDNGGHHPGLSAWAQTGFTPTHMASMFEGATSFRGNVSLWNTSRATTIARLFAGAVRFDGDVSRWEVSSVEDMTSAFENATRSATPCSVAAL